METTGQKVRRMFVHIFAAYGGSFLWVTAFVTALRLAVAPKTIGGHIPCLSATHAFMAEYFPVFAAKVTGDPVLLLFLVLFFAPVTEEVIFRMLPLSAVQVLKRLLPAEYAETYGNALTVAVVVGVCGIIFGLAHGHPMNVFIQGVTGVMLGWVYLKNDESQATSYLSAVFVHAAYNFTVMMA